MKFGVFADAHYAEKEDDGERFFSRAEEKIEKCLRVFRKEQAEFMVCLGDLTDDRGKKEEKRKRLEKLQAMIRESGIPFYLVLGNHDTDMMEKNASASPFGVFSGGYGSFDCGGMHFVILDANYGADGRRYTMQDMKWDELYLNEPQLQWLKQDLKGSSRPSVVLVHANLDGRMRDGERDPHVIVNHREVRGILEESGKVVLVLQGHDHGGALTVQRGITYVTAKALVNGAWQAPGIIVTCIPLEEKYQIHFFDGAEMDEGRTN